MKMKKRMSENDEIKSKKKKENHSLSEEKQSEVGKILTPLNKQKSKVEKNLTRILG